jgi:hypothetical protein
MPRPPRFREEDKIKMLLWCARYCCLCGKNAGPDIEIAHIDNKAGNNIDNGIPLCYDCHAKIGHYTREHPRGNKYKPEELKARREQVYEEHTRHLVPPLHFFLTQTRANGIQHQIPFIGFHLQHLGDSLPVNVRVEAKVLIGEEDLGIVNDASGYYTGAVKWNINPRILFWGGFSIDNALFERAEREDLKVEVRITVIDQFGREHKLLPQCWKWVRARDGAVPFWNLEPRSFTEWT